MMASGSVIRVDSDVLSAQVAGPDRGLLRAARPKVDFDVDVLARQIRRCLLRVLVVRLSALEQHDAADTDRRSRELKWNAGSAGRRDKTPPVWIATVHRGLHQ